MELTEIEQGLETLEEDGEDNLEDDASYDSDDGSPTEQRKALEKCFVAGPKSKRQFVMNKHKIREWHPDRSIDPQNVVDQDKIVDSCFRYLPWLEGKLTKSELEQVVYWVSLCIRNEKQEQIQRTLEQCRVIGFKKVGEEEKRAKDKEISEKVECGKGEKIRDLVVLTKGLSKWIKEEGSE